MENNTNELYHYGVKGMKWGVRRYQSQDGSLTPAGKKRYSSNVVEAKAAYKQAKKDYNQAFGKAYNRNIGSFSPIKKHRDASTQRWEDAFDKAETLNKAKAEYKQAKKLAKDTYKKAENDAFARYEKSIADIEKNYKRGQMLSEKDQAREAAVESQYRKDVAAAKTEYNRAMGKTYVDRVVASETSRNRNNKR